MKPTVKRHLFLDFVPQKLNSPAFNHRITKMNSCSINEGYIVYLISRDFRIEDNWAIAFARILSKTLNKKILILPDITILKEPQLSIFKKFQCTFENNCIINNFDISYDIEKINNAGLILTDFNPLIPSKNFNIAHFEVDSHNICPTRYISFKQEYSAATLRRKIYANIAYFLTNFPELNVINNYSKTEAYKLLNNFVKNNLKNYAEFKNNINNDVTSNLSPYLNLGLISSQRVVLEILKSNVKRENKEAFLEEIITRKELADNYCFYNNNYHNFSGIPIWGQNTLVKHKNDIRTHIYTKKEFEKGETHDKTWNKLQISFVKSGCMHGYARMFWAKKILEWSNSPKEALDIAIYLNNKYALDGNSPTSYTGILWSIGGLHDRPFKDREVTGSIRIMTKL